MQSWLDLPKKDKLRAVKLLTELENRKKRERIARIQEAKKSGQLTPAVVADFAYLAMTDEGQHPITPAAHHWLWLELMCNNDIDNLLIIANPGSAKTTWVIAYVACLIGFFPEYPTIYAAITADVADKRSMSIKTIVESEIYNQIFPEVKRVTGSVLKYEQKEWSVAPNGKPRPGRIHPTLLAAGVNGTVIGSRARMLIGDDLLDKNSTRTAASRDKTHEWLDSQLLPRAMPQLGRTIIIGNSYHHDDAYARIKKLGNWTVCHMSSLSNSPEVYASITYPAKYEGETLGEPMTQEGGKPGRHYRYLLHKNGPALWPEYIPLSYLLEKQATTIPSVWSATYQGLATPPGGTIFKREWFNKSGGRYDPQIAQGVIARYISFDTAMKAKQENDATGYVVCDLLADYRLLVRFASAKRLEFPDLVKEIQQVATEWNSDGKLTGILIEDKSSGTSAIQTLKATAPDWLTRKLFDFLPTTDKITRASQSSVWCANGSILLPFLSSDLYWLADFEDELFDFPGAAHDDRVDALSQLVLYLERYLEAGFHSRTKQHD